MSGLIPDPVDLAIRGAARAAGTGLAAVFAVTARLRHDKPLHPTGAVAAATLSIRGAEAGSSGSPLLDEPAVHRCIVRTSYALGTGPRLPDVEGLALRILPGDPDGKPIDLLLASTGAGSLSRFALALRLLGAHGTQTTLLPVRAGGHALELRLEPSETTEPSAPSEPGGPPWPSRYELSWAHGSGPWHGCGELTIAWDDVQDEPGRFDPIRNPLPGTSQYPAVAALREPAYLWSRRAWPRAGHLPEGVPEESS